jgi:hypothetical protein
VVTLAQPAAGQGTFAPGTREILALSFASTQPGQLPAGVRLVNGRVDVVDKDGVRMLRATGPAEFVVTLPEALPTDFTLEFDLIAKPDGGSDDLTFEGTARRSASSVSAEVKWSPTTQSVSGGGLNEFSAATPASLSETLPGQLARIIASFSGTTLKLYTNGVRLYTLTDRLFVRGTVLRVVLGGQDEEHAVYLARLRVAAGAGSLAAATSVVALPAATPTATITPIAPAQESPPLERAPLGGTPTSLSGPAPTGLTVTGTPGTATLAWAEVAGATGYVVQRAPVGSTAWTPLTADRISETKLSNDLVPNPLATYTYRVTAYQADGRFGSATVDFTPPPPSDPTELVATLVPPAGVKLTWKAANGASEYVVSGPGFPSDARTATTSISLLRAPLGLNVYRVASVFPPGKVLTAPSTWPKATINVPPTPSVAFLTLPNGTGSLAEYNRHACNAGKWVAAEMAWPNDWCALPGPYSVANTEFHHLLKIFGVRLWVEGTNDFPPPPPWATFSQFNWFEESPPGSCGGLTRKGCPRVTELEFIDNADLALHRRVGCFLRGTPPNAATLCWALSRKPGEPPPPGLGENLAQRGSSLNIIIKEPNGTHFLAFREVQDPSSPTGWKMAGLPSVELDSQGERFLPHACLSCHGGRFDQQTGRVTDASFLALDPRGLSGPDGSTVSQGSYGWPEKLSHLHSRMLHASVAPGVQAYINDLYPGDVLDLSAIPAGWTSQPNVYSRVYRPYCGSCHSTQAGPLGFRSWSDFLREKVRIKQAICTGRMPHAEVPFRKFWTEGGEVSLPGWLLGVLGYAGCEG